jgi:hypothetical protein
LAAEKPVQVTNIIPPVGLTALPGLKTGARKTDRIDRGNVNVKRYRASVRAHNVIECCARRCVE